MLKFLSNRPEKLLRRAWRRKREQARQLQKRGETERGMRLTLQAEALHEELKKAEQQRK